MGLKLGIIGLPNVGKSTIFNALTCSNGAQTANYPFCTIDPNVGVVEVPDERLEILQKIVNPEKVVKTVIEFVDIAGLVKGASKGEGLGNQFLSHIRECDALVQVIRCFEDENVSHVHNCVDPKDDIETIQTELILADLQTVQKRIEKARSDAKSGEKSKKEYAELIEKLEKTLGEGKLGRETDFSEDEMTQIRDLHLLTIKPMLYIANIGESQVKDSSEEAVRDKMHLPEKVEIIPIAAHIEMQLNDFQENEAKELLKELGMERSGLLNLIQKSYKMLNLETFFTAGPKEVRAWTIEKGSLAPQAAGKIHSDFEKGFIKAEVIAYEDFVQYKGEKGAMEKGKMRHEGKNYIVHDGDVIYFRFNKS